MLMTFVDRHSHSSGIRLARVKGSLAERINLLLMRSDFVKPEVRETAVLSYKMITASGHVDLWLCLRRKVDHVESEAVDEGF